MGILRGKRASIAVLLLAALTFTGLLAHGHQHDPLVRAHGHADLPSYSGGHHQPIPRAHIEGATRIERSSCDVCLHQQRQRGTESLAAALGDLAPDSTGVEIERSGSAAVGTFRIPASRAPPSA